jgi:hypothetical protein
MGTFERTKAVFQRIPYPVRMAILIVVLAKLLIFSVGYAVTYVNEGPLPPLTILQNQFVHPFAPQDSQHYIDIAREWYVSDPNLDHYNFIVFFPLYPILIRLITFDFSYAGVSALLISNVSSIIALFYLFKLAKLDFDSNVAVKAVLFLSIFPTAYFLAVPYTEGLFFALAISSFYYARLGKWPLAGVLGFFASLTRLGGLLMLPVLIIEYLHQSGWKPRKLVSFNTLWICMALLGFLTYLNINYQTTGDAFKFVEIEKVHWFSTLDPVKGLTTAISWATNAAPPQNLLLGIAPITFAVFGLFMIIAAAWLRLRPSYIIYMLLTWMLSISYSFWISPPRYIMAMFPMFIVLGILSRRRIAVATVAVAFVVPLCYFTALFSLGNLVF